MKDFLAKNKDLIFLIFVAVIILLVFSTLPYVFKGHYVVSSGSASYDDATSPKKVVFVPTYVSTPESVKGIYMSSWVAGDRNIRNRLVKLIDETELNSVVIDIKDYSGKIVFSLDNNPELKSYGSEDVRVKDMSEFIESLHKKGVYVIGRIAVFQDAYFVKHRPDLAVKNKAGDATWRDRKGISWVDPGSHEYWSYIVEIAEESRKIGFDEINFDYIRFPSDGDMEDISFPWSSTTPKSKVIKNFFSYLQQNLFGSGLKTSADLFGMTTTAFDDMGIGQVLENALPYFDYISPMVYPSHYPTQFLNFADPEQHPYDVIKYAMQSAVERAKLASTTPAKLRPWLQDFGLHNTYGPNEVRAQIQATNDVGLNSWLLWSASNVYNQGALNVN